MMDDFTRFMGLDHGEKRIGVALSDPLRITARPEAILSNDEPEAVLRALKDLTHRQDVSKIIVGLPTNSESEIGYQAKIVLEWCHVLAKTVSVPIVLWDETGSSAAVGKVKAKKSNKHVDDQAAAAILQDYLIAFQGSLNEPGQPFPTAK